MDRLVLDREIALRRATEAERAAKAAGAAPAVVQEAARLRAEADVVVAASRAAADAIEADRVARIEREIADEVDPARAAMLARRAEFDSGVNSNVLDTQNRRMNDLFSGANNTLDTGANPNNLYQVRDREHDEVVAIFEANQGLTFAQIGQLIDRTVVDPA